MGTQECKIAVTSASINVTHTAMTALLEIAEVAK